MNFDGTIEVSHANGSSVEYYKDGKLVIKDQTEPEKPNGTKLTPNTGGVSEQGTLLAGLLIKVLGVGHEGSFNGKKRDLTSSLSGLIDCGLSTLLAKRVEKKKKGIKQLYVVWFLYYS